MNKDRTNIAMLIAEELFRCFATPNTHIKTKILNPSALADFFYVNICALFCCIILRFT